MHIAFHGASIDSLPLRFMDDQGRPLNTMNNYAKKHHLCGKQIYCTYLEVSLVIFVIVFIIRHPTDQ